MSAFRRRLVESTQSDSGLRAKLRRVRVFAAIFPPDDAVDDLAEITVPMQQMYPDLRWAQPPLWHLTLAYFGNITQADQGQLNRAVASFVAERETLRVRLVGAGTFSEPNVAQTLWAGVDSQQDALLHLSGDLVTAVQHFGWTLDRRSFRAHLTLARAQPGRDLLPLVDQLSDYTGPFWDVPSIAVVWARQAEDGEPVYELLGEHTFTPPER